MSNPTNIDQKLAIHGGKPVRTKPLPAWPSYDEEIEAAIEVLRSGKHARQSGSYVAQFEAAFATYFGVNASSRDIFGCSKNRQNRIVENSTYPLDDFGFR